MLITINTKTPGITISYDELVSSSRAKVIAAHYKNPEEQWMHIEEHQQVAMEDDERKTHKWQQGIQIEDKF